MVDVERQEAERRRTILKKYKGLIGDQLKLTDFKEPVIFLIRRNGEIQLYENAIQKDFKYKHTDNTERIIWLNQKNLYSFPYGNKTFKVYLCHEDYPTPIPEEPIVTVETIQLQMEKTLSDLHKWKTAETTAIGDAAFKILLGVGAIIGMIALYKLLVPAAPATAAATPPNPIIKEISANASDYIRNLTR